MDNIKMTLENWLNQLGNFNFKNYEDLTDIDLYMEQVIGFLERQLSIFQTSSLDKQITPSMINNYVKGGVITSPISKKYSREHIAQIEEVCTLKNVLSIAEVKQVVDFSIKNKDVKADAFNSFNRLNNKKINEAVEDAFKGLNDIEDNDTESLTSLAMDFALTANAYITISKRILFLTRLFEAEKKRQAELALKNKNKEKDDTVE